MHKLIFQCQPLLTFHRKCLVLLNLSCSQHYHTHAPPSLVLYCDVLADKVSLHYLHDGCRLSIADRVMNLC